MGGAEASGVHPTTVVVPVYGDPSTLIPCVESLLANVDQSVHRVLLVNDCGPQADEIEKALLTLIDGQAAFAYARNPRNLGFVGTCNRAAYELDTTDNDILFLNSDTVTTPGFIEELSSVLHLSPQHGAVCPRSNNATIASLPFKLRDPSAGRTVERTRAVHSFLKHQLPKFSIAPVAMGFCLLIRRDLIRSFGLFDEVFAPGYGEENDFCLRIAQHGFQSVIAHHALVFHLGGRSFVGGRREALRSAHENILKARYPNYHRDVNRYLYLDRDPVDVFADALVRNDQPMRVLIDLEEVPLNRDGARYAALLAVANRRSRTDLIDITVSVPSKHAKRVARKYRSLNIRSHEELDGLWDIALASPLTASTDQLARLNRTSLRWVAGDQVSTDVNDWCLQTEALNRLEPVALFEKLGKEWGNQSPDIAGLRARWRSIIASMPGLQTGATMPGQPRLRRTFDLMERAAPQVIGRLKSAIRRIRASFLTP